jgi:VCBS repeat-containing protein
MMRHGLSAFLFTISLSFAASSALGATTDFRVLLDVDDNAATGCSVAGMSGVDQILLTRVETTATTASVTRTSRQVCTAGVLGAETDVITTGWSAGFNASSGTLLVETRMPISALGTALPHEMRIGVEAQQGSAIHTAIARRDGSAPVFPEMPRGRRRATSPPGAVRVIIMDGDGTDWLPLTALIDGIAAGGSSNLRILRFFAFSAADGFLYFRFDANLSTDAPVAVDDEFPRPAGAGVTVPAPGVLLNDINPSGTPLTAMPVSQPSHGDLTLNPDGGFTYTPDDPTSTRTDSFEYKASNGKESNAARVEIPVTAAENTAPIFSSTSTPNVAEGTTTVVSLSAPDPDGDTVTYSITGGADQSRFSITGGNTLVFNSAPDYEVPLSAGGTNSYVVQVTANDGQGHTTVQSLTVTVTNVDEAPVFTPPSSFSVQENTTAVGSVNASDPDGTTISYSISGADAADFTINSSNGTLTFASAPDFEAPQDSGANNVYTVQVTATDATGTATSQTVNVTVTDVNEAPAFTSSATPAMPENTTAAVTVTVNDPEGNAIVFSITGGADQAKFTINSATGALSFLAAPNFEAPTDTDANNIYLVQVTATDGATPVTQNIAVTVTNVNEPPSITSGNVAAVAENTTTVLTVTSTDSEGNTVTYSISGGADAALFTINASTGALTFITAPNFEAPADAGANNVYDVTVTANDGTNNVAQSIAVTVTNVNEAPAFTSTATPSVAENTTAVVTVATTDQEGQAVVYTLTGGADQARFAINASTGALTFNAAPNFEAPADADTNNIYLVQVTASDGTNNAVQNLSVTVTNVNEAPVITSSNTATVPENTIVATTVTATDQEGNAIAYSLTGGADQARFSIDATTGVLSFSAPPNFEAPADANTDNQYVVQVTATDGTTPVNQIITVTVTNVNEAPVFTSGTTPSVVEGTTAVTTVTTTDEEGNTVTYSIVGGADAADFSINAATGALTFTVAPNYEAPADADTNNIYSVTVRANDGTNNTDATLTVTVTDANEAPSITSPNAASIPENTTAAMTVTSTDPEGNAVTYSITGGADAARFSINASTGALTFNAAPNFEAPADAGANNVYDVQVTATDGTNPVTQNIAITVTDVNEAPVFTSSATPSAAENQTAAVTVTTTDQEGNPITYSISGGADAALFSINSSTGVVTFNSAPNFEAPADAGANNVYDIVVTASDGTNAPTQNIAITVTDVNEAPVFTSSATPSAAENQTAAVTVTTTDQESNTITYSISGGADAALFSINSSTGVVTFNSAPNFEAPADAGANNVYDIVVTASDGTNAPTQNIAITVTDANEAPLFTSSATPSAAENQTAAVTVTTTDQESNTITYSISGGADAALFSINSSTGVVTFNSAPNFEAPADAGANNVYDIVVTASDGTNAPTQNIAVTVTDVNEAPSFTSSAAPSAAENQTAAVTVTATDPEGNTITYSITGGADAALFSINTSTGVVTFNSAPNFEAPADAGANNVYDIVVTASDGTNAPTQNIAITVTDANEVPSFTSSATPTVAENGTTVVTVTTTDPEGDTIAYSITGGADAALFSINGSTGALTFNAAPNYEAPADAGANNVYEVVVTADDGPNAPTQTITVTVTDVNEGPAITSGNTASFNEDATGTVLTVTATDPEGDTVTYAISGGADSGDLSINVTSGAITFNAPPDYEAPADSDTNNSYVIQVTATSTGGTAVQTITITVNNVNDPPVITSVNTASVSENTAGTFHTVTATDADLTTPTYSISGGADALDFNINATTGAVSFAVAPNFEAPADANGDNVYEITVRAHDATTFDEESLTITVTNVNEAPAFTSSATPSAAENQTAVVTVTTTDPENNTVTYSITGGADQALFSINSSTGVLTFNSAPNFEAPADAGANNVYNVVVTASDGTNAPTQAIAVTVTDVNDPPVFTSSASPSAAENQTAAVTVTTSDPESNTITYSITGGADAALLSINSATGAVTFNSAPNFEAPADAGTNNVYDIIVTANDGVNAPTQAIAITVTNVNEAPSFTSASTASAPENSTSVVTVTTTDPEGNAITYSISGGADQARFTINGATGVLSFVTPPNFEVPTDTGANNVYDVVVTASDGTNAPTQAIAVTVTDVEEPPVFASPTAAANFNENATGTVLTATATDDDGDTVTYTITGGTDSGDLTIDANTGAITFNVSPNFEAPADSDTNNTYVIEVTATSTGGTGLQTITVTVANVNEQPTITSGAPANVAENTAGTVHTVTATDPDGTSPTFAIVGGADAADFNINATTGAISFVTAPNFEAPADANTDNVYELTVRATDGSLFDDEAYTITVTNVNEAPTATTDAYTYIGNTELRIDGHAGTTNALAFTTDLDNLLDNDTDPDSAASGFANLSVVAAGPTTSANGSVYEIETDGTMRFTPGAGFTGTDAITYQLTDGTNTVNGTINFTLEGTDVVWYVRNNDPTVDSFASNNGTSSDPFNTLAEAQTASGVNHIIYVHAGDGTTTGQNSGIVLKNGQKLYGQGIALVVNGSTTLIPAGAQPQIGNAAGAGVTVSNLSGIDIRGLNIGASGDAISAALTVASTVTINISENTIRAAGTEGIEIDASAGSYMVSIHDNTITSTGNSIDIAESGSGQITVTAFDDNTISGFSGATGIAMSGVTFDGAAGAPYTTVLGGVTSIGSSGNPVGASGMVLSNVSGELSFSALNIYAGNGSGLTVSGTSSTFNAAGGSGFRIANSNAADVINATNGAAVDLTALNASLSGVLTSTGSATTGVNLNNVSGSITGATGSAISGIGAAATAFKVANSSANTTWNGTINVTQGKGVELTTNSGTYAFTGLLTLSTGANTAFAATGGGTVTSTHASSTITTTTGTAVNIGTTIGAAGVTLQSVNSITAGSNVTIALASTGSGAFTINGVGTTAGSGGTIDNKTADAITLNNTGGLVTLKNMIIEDIGSTAGAFHTISNHDAIHGQDVNGGLTLDNVTIRRISDNAIHGATLAGNASTVWNGLSVNNSTFQFTNRYHVAGSGDANNEGMIRIDGVRGTVVLTNNTFEDAGEHVDFFVNAGTLTMTAQNNNFNRSYKEFTSGTTASIGNHCVDVTVRNLGSATLTIGSTVSAALGNDFLNCRIGSVRVVNDTGSTGTINATIGRNNFVVNDHSSGFGGDFDFPMGGVLVWSLATGGVTNARLSGNYFDETTRASGALGSIGVLADGGTLQARIDSNTFDTLGDGTWQVRATDGGTGRVQIDNNQYINGTFTCPDPSCAGGYQGPALYQLAEAQEGGTLHLTNSGETYSAHDTSYYPGNSLEARVNNVGAASTMCVALANLKAPQGYALEQYAGTFNLFRGASAFTGACTTAQCQSVLQSNNVLGGGGNINQAPPTVNLAGTVNVTATACQQPSGSIF